MLRTLASRWNKQKFRCYEAKIEESEKADSEMFPQSREMGNLSLASDIVGERLHIGVRKGIHMTCLHWLQVFDLCRA